MHRTQLHKEILWEPILKKKMKIYKKNVSNYGSIELKTLSDNGLRPQTKSSQRPKTKLGLRSQSTASFNKRNVTKSLETLNDYLSKEYKLAQEKILVYGMQKDEVRKLIDEEYELRSIAFNKMKRSIK